MTSRTEASAPMKEAMKETVDNNQDASTGKPLGRETPNLPLFRGFFINYAPNGDVPKRSGINFKYPEDHQVDWVSTFYHCFSRNHRLLTTWPVIRFLPVTGGFTCMLIIKDSLGRQSYTVSPQGVVYPNHKAAKRAACEAAVRLFMSRTELPVLLEGEESSTTLFSIADTDEIM